MHGKTKEIIKRILSLLLAFVVIISGMQVNEMNTKAEDASTTQINSAYNITSAFYGADGNFCRIVVQDTLANGGSDLNVISGAVYKNGQAMDASDWYIQKPWTAGYHLGFDRGGSAVFATGDILKLDLIVADSTGTSVKFDVSFKCTSAENTTYSWSLTAEPTHIHTGDTVEPSSVDYASCTANAIRLTTLEDTLATQSGHFKILDGTVTLNGETVSNDKYYVEKPWPYAETNTTYNISFDVGDPSNWITFKTGDKLVIDLLVVDSKGVTAKLDNIKMTNVGGTSWEIEVEEIEPASINNAYNITSAFYGGNGNFCRIEVQDTLANGGSDLNVISGAVYKNGQAMDASDWYIQKPWTDAYHLGFDKGSAVFETGDILKLDLIVADSTGTSVKFDVSFKCTSAENTTYSWLLTAEPTHIHTGDTVEPSSVDYASCTANAIRLTTLEDTLATQSGHFKILDGTVTLNGETVSSAQYYVEKPWPYAETNTTYNISFDVGDPSNWITFKTGDKLVIDLLVVDSKGVAAKIDNIKMTNVGDTSWEIEVEEIEPTYIHTGDTVELSSAAGATCTANAIRLTTVGDTLAVASGHFKILDGTVTLNGETVSSDRYYVEKPWGYAGTTYNISFDVGDPSNWITFKTGDKLVIDLLVVDSNGVAAKLDNIKMTNVGGTSWEIEVKPKEVEQKTPEELGYARVVLKDFSLSDGTYPEAVAPYNGVYKGDSLNKKYLDVDVESEPTALGIHDGAFITFAGTDAGGWLGVRIVRRADKFLVWATDAEYENEVEEIALSQVKMKSEDTSYNMKVGVQLSGEDVIVDFWINDIRVPRMTFGKGANLHFGTYVGILAKDVDFILSTPGNQTSAEPEKLPDFKTITLGNFDIEDGTYEDTFVEGGYAFRLDKKIFSVDVQFGAPGGCIRYGSMNTGWAGLNFYTRNGNMYMEGLGYTDNGVEAVTDLYLFNAIGAGVKLEETPYNLKISTEYVDSDQDGKKDDVKLGVWFNDKLYENTYIYLQDYVQYLGQLLGIYSPTKIEYVKVSSVEGIDTGVDYPYFGFTKDWRKELGLE